MYATHTHVGMHNIYIHNSMHKMLTSKIQLRNSKQALIWLQTIIFIIEESLNY